MLPVSWKPDDNYRGYYVLFRWLLS